jgi:hypothetical protein
MPAPAYCAVYDFQLLPYALGDVLTWNIQTALRCAEVGRQRVDAFICMDASHPSSIYQRNLVVAENCALYLNELFSAFGTHPSLGNIYLFGSCEEMVERLRDLARADAVNGETLSDYERALGAREDTETLNRYFIKYIYSHERLNHFADRHGRIPLLTASRGCEPDVQGLLATLFADKRIVVIHPRLRQLDNGLGGEHTYFRDSDFLEWYEFLRAAAEKHPEVQFVVVGRLQEKPLELLRLPNVISLRTLGLGLGHDLTLMLHADLFIGTSSGFAAMANFSTVPYFITKVNKETCNAYGIAQGSTRLPFATPNQLLVYEPETSAMLMDLLDRGLATVPRRPTVVAPVRSTDLSVRGFERERARWLYPAATTSRFFTDDLAADQETALLVWPRLQQGFAALARGDRQQARSIARQIGSSFPRLWGRSPELTRLARGNKLPLSRRAFDALNQHLTGLNSEILPAGWRGTALHSFASRIKSAILRYIPR